jgi:predicted NBD/HSP70 family sugar kinase
VSARVGQLIEHGYVREDGSDESRGGRRPRRLRIENDDGRALIGAIDLGTHHARLGLADLTGNLLGTTEVAVRIQDGPTAVMTQLYRQLCQLADDEHGTWHSVRAIGVAIPAPVDQATGDIILPSRMSGWHMANPRMELGTLTNVPVLVDNDANLMALGEHARLGATSQHLLVAKIGTGIGLGIVADGHLHRGARGGAGDISHVPVDGPSILPCTCGNTSCLESVASGGALVERLRRDGLDVDNPTDIVVLERDGNVRASQALRAAGQSIGSVLALIVDFFNPDTLALGGALAASEPLVATVRSSLYERCLPLSSKSVTVTTCATGLDAGLSGGIQLALDHLLSVDEVNRRLAGASHRKTTPTLQPAP